MPTKHISDAVWDKVQKETYQTVITTGTVVKEEQVLKQLILKGLSTLKTESDYKEMARRIKG